MRSAGVVRGAVALYLLCCPATAFLGYDWFGSSEEPWNVCAKDLCNCKEGLLAAMSDGLDCSYRDINGLADDMIIPGEYTKADFSGNNISAVSPSTFYGNNTNVQRLLLSANSLSLLQEGAFKALTSLQELDLGNNNLHNLSSNSFSGLESLTRLDLSYNLLTSLPENIFIPTPKISTIILDFNPIKTLPDNVFHGLIHLRKLDLSGLNLATVHQDMFAGLNISELKLSSNLLKNVPTKALFQISHSLTHLDLSGNPIQTLPQYAFYSLPRLTSVTLEQMTRLTSIESYAFWEVPSLRTIVLRYLPRISFIDEKAFTTTHNSTDVVCPMQDFTLSYTTMTSLPEHLLNWQEVKYINLHNNRWNCDCLFSWVKGSPIDEKIGHHFYCSAPPRVRGSQLDWLTKKDFECRPEDYSRSVQWAVVAGLLVAGTLVSLLTVAVLFYRRHGYVFRPPKTYDQLTNATSRDSITVYDSAPRADAGVQRKIEDATA